MQHVAVIVPSMQTGANQVAGAVLLRYNPRMLRNALLTTTALALGVSLGALGSSQSTEVRLVGKTYTVSDIGLGARPAGPGVILIGNNAALTHWKRATEAIPETNLSIGELEALPGEVAVPVEAGDLVTRASFGDHRIHVEWLSPPGGEGQQAGNSGVYIQGRYEIQVLGTKSGNSPPADNEAGAIYGFKAADVNASTGPGTWQSYDIWFCAPRFKDGQRVEGARITVLWNGRLIHQDIEIANPTGGAIAGGEAPRPAGDIQVGPLVLQAHTTDAEGPVRYRNVWVKPLDELPREWGEWRTIEITDDLAGWEVIGGEAKYRAQDGEIIGNTVPDTPNTFLATKELYGDFELELELKAHPELNSGVQFRSDGQNGQLHRMPIVTGYQMEVEHDGQRNWAGGVYDEAGRGWLYPLYADPRSREAFKSNEWNQYRIVCRGGFIETYVNGVWCARMMDDLRPKGFIALQIHGVGDRQDPMEIRWRNIRIREPRPVEKSDEPGS